MFDQILSQVQSVSHTHARILIAIDGRGGAGKSTFARKLAAEFSDVSTIEFDWFHLPQDQVGVGCSYDFERFALDIVQPFRKGVDTLEFKKYNWGYLVGKPDGLESASTRIPSPRILIVEGCNTLSNKIANCFDVRIWIDTDAGEALRRGMHRDIYEYGLDAPKVEQQWKAWSKQEHQNLVLDDRRSRADFKIN